LVPSAKQSTDTRSQGRYETVSRLSFDWSIRVLRGVTNAFASSHRRITRFSVVLSVIEIVRQ